VNLPKTPQQWAIHLTKLLNAFTAAHGLERFPINIVDIACEFSKHAFPDAPITAFEGIKTSNNFEGALFRNPERKNEWGIFYNDNIQSAGRKNFTLAHEFGHYLLHRTAFPDGLQCSPKSMLDWDEERGEIEGQANTFASFFLMPLDDFRAQIKGEKPSMDLMCHLADRYAVSLSAATLKWLDVCCKRAMIVFGRDGYIDWAWSSKELLSSGIFYRSRSGPVIELPKLSLAARQDPLVDNRGGILHPKGIWPGQEEVHEMTILGKKGDMTVSLLLYPDDAPNRFAQADDNEDGLMDTYEKFVRGGQV
jgi:hypothetical protein